MGMQIPRAKIPSGLMGHVGVFYLHRALTLCFPLLLLPVIAYRLAPGAMGVLFVLQAWSLMLVYVIDYGFSAYGARSIAQSEYPAARSHEISRILSAQILLSAALLPAWLLLCNFIPMLQDHFWNGMLPLLMGAATALTPNWYFLGTQKLMPFVITDIICRMAVLLGILFLPYEDYDHLFAFAVMTAGQVIAAAISIYILSRHEILKWVSMQEAVRILRQNWRLCLAETGMAFSVNFNTILLSLFASPAIIAAYGVAEKIIRGCGALLVALTQALYPHFTQMQKDAALSLEKLMLWGIGSNGALTLAASLFIWLLAPVILPYLAKDDPAFALTLTYWQIPALFLFGLQGTLYMHGLLARRHDGAALTAILLGAIVYALGGIAAVMMQSVIGVIIAQTLNFTTVIAFACWRIAQKKTPAE